MTKKNPNCPDFLLWLLLPVSISLHSITAQAQLIPDNTLGTESSTLNQLNQIKTLIEGGATRGQNLFHSFLEFNINNGQQVYFVNPDGVNNILTRVTGDNISQIFGTLGVNGNANLFLLNPHGFIFGGNATLDLNGSFIATTEAINLGNGNFFSATDIQGSSLLNIQPEAKFNSGVGRIENRANLVVKEGNNLILMADKVVNRGSLLSYGDLTLQGNTLDLQGTLGAQNNLTLLGNNNIQIRDTLENPFIAVSGADMLLQSPKIDIFALNHPDSGLFSGKDLKMRSSLPVIGDAHYWSGGSFKVETLDSNLGNLQSIDDPVIRSLGDVSIGSYEGTSLHIIAGGSVDVGTVYITGVATGTNGIDFIKEIITLSDGTTLEIDGSQQATLDIRAGVKPDAIGTPTITGLSFFDPIPSINEPATSANITIGDVINNGDNGLIYLSNQYQPNEALSGGDIIITGRGYLEDGYGIQLSGNAVLDSRNNIDIDGQFYGVGIYSYGGNIFLKSKNEINLSNGALIDTRDYFSTTGDSGNIEIKTNNLNLTNSSSLNTGTLANAGSVKIIGTGNINFSDSNITATSAGNNGGDVSIETKRDVTLSNSQIFSNSSFATDTNHKSGDININANSLTLSNNSKLFSFGSGIDETTGSDAGNITIETLSLGFVKLDQGSIIYSSTNNAGDRGNVLIETGKLSLFNGSEIYTGVDGSQDAGSLTINASEKVEVIGSQQTDNGYQGSRLATRTNGNGNAGKLSIETPTLIIQNGGNIETNTSGEGKAGDLIINAPVAISLTGNTPNGLNASVINSLTTSAGNAGNIQINTGKLTVKDGGYISSETVFGDGKGGNLNIIATDAIEVSGNRSLGGNPSSLKAATSGSGNAGNIDLKTNTLIVKDGGEISSTTLGKGSGGNVDITANSSINIESANSLTLIPSQITTRAFLFSEGNAGNISLKTGNLTISNGAQISALTNSSGKAGSININADNILIDTFGKIRASTSNSGNAGNIEINALNGELKLTIGGTIESNIESGGSGNAGNIDLTANKISLIDGGVIGSFVRGPRFNQDGTVSIPSGQGNGGNITLRANDINIEGFFSNSVTSFPSQINAGVDNYVPEGYAGTIDITANNSLILKDNAQI